MREWWNRKKEKMRKRKENNDNYRFLDFMLDVLFWIPELVLLPFRMIIWLFSGIGRLLRGLFDIV
ncbi:hypothetical protein [Virgibacillus necropolis]|uniref:Uncharacterized protein n=1 Tax=Virgibacillus necropolis TaxID=163877 RepID=A0A221MFI3_9BACI|nr:hypothetical protein [Virgibacillus necropolis]ASN06433.1 hypothetical protein CFK40_16115 [Virgibacillus necropolis]